MRDDYFQRLPGVGLQVRFKKGQFLGRQFFGPAIIQDREMRLPVIETVVRGVRRVLPE